MRVVAIIESKHEIAAIVLAFDDLVGPVVPRAQLAGWSALPSHKLLTVLAVHQHPIPHCQVIPWFPTIV